MGPKERTLFIALAFAALFILVLFLLFLYFLILNQRKLYLAQKEIMRADFHSSEEERKKIALELHNDIIPLLSGIKLRMSLIESKNVHLNQECINNLEKSINEIRGISKKISPMYFDGESLGVSLQNYIQSSEIDKLIDIEIIKKDIITLEKSKHYLIFRLLQEVIQNTIKHSKATVLKIEFSMDANTFIIRTSDNGIGYNIRSVRKSKGMGLKSIQHIISELGGVMHKAGPEYRGTKYNFKIPIQNEKK